MGTAKKNVGIGIRRKLILCFAAPIALVVFLGIINFQFIYRIGNSIEVILKENYSSLMACQQMESALEDIDNGIQFNLIGDDEASREVININVKKFNEGLALELENITLPGEGEKASGIKKTFETYFSMIPDITNDSIDIDVRKARYFNEMIPLLKKMLNIIKEIHQMNSNNIIRAKDTAMEKSHIAKRRVVFIMIVCILMAVMFSMLVRMWILKPIRSFIGVADEIRKGNLDISVSSGAGDEFGQLSQAFNTMTEELRNLRRMERIELTRTRRARDELFSALPGVVAMFDLNGNVEASTDMAKKYFGLRQGSHVSEAGMDWINDLVGRILKGEIEARPKDNSGIISHLIDGREHFFSPLAIPIPFNPDKQAEPEGVTLMLKDVTHACSVKDESGIEMVYKRIKPILTSLQMSIYMLLNEKAGEINERQIDLLISARDESDRIHAILTKLEDIERMESGSIQLDIQNISPGELLKESVEPFVTEARDKGVTLIVNPESIPDYVMADRSYIKSVFANILSNAVKFTMPGGSITVGARPEGRFIEFFIRDTGIGISEEKIASIFEPFSGISDGNDSGSTGLGLSLAREIVRAHGGEIRVKSAPGAGSTFYFTLRKSIQVKDQ